MKVASRHVLAAAVGLRLALASHDAHAWVETHLLADDVRVELDRAGTAVVGHTIRLRVQGGPLHWVDVPDVDADAVALDGAVIGPEKAGQLVSSEPVTPSRRSDGTWRLSVNSARGVSRGQFVLQFRYRTSFLGTERLVRDGRSWRVRWTGPSWTEGLDNARCTFVVPTAPDEPRAARPRDDDRGSDPEALSAFLSAVRRGREGDEVELLRPHVARAEIVQWTAYVDGRAFDDGADRGVSGPLSTAATGEESSRPIPVRMWLLFACTLAFSALVGTKARAVASDEPQRAKRSRPLVPLPAWARTALAGPLLAAGIALQYEAFEPYWGALVLLAVMALATYAPAQWRAEPRGPGQWLALRDGDAFAPPASPRYAWIDASTWQGKLACAVVGLGVLASTILLRNRSPYDACLVAFDSLVLLPLWWTGRQDHRAPDLFTTPAASLRTLAHRLRAQGLRAVAWGRWPKGGSAFDELRLMVAPRPPLPGFTGIEIGFASAGSAGATLRQPEVLVRVVDGTRAHDALRALLRGHRWVRGRKPDERVALLQPRLPTLACTVALAKRIADAVGETEIDAAEATHAAGRAERRAAKGSAPSKALAREPVARAYCPISSGAAPLARPIG